MRLISEGKSTIELLPHAGKTDSSLERICKYHCLYSSVHRESSYVGFLNLKNDSESSSISGIKAIKQNEETMRD